MNKWQYSLCHFVGSKTEERRKRERGQERGREENYE